MVPGVLTLAPRFVLVRDLGLVNTPFALISVWVSGGLVLSTWLMRSYFESLPPELFDAAYVDGAAEWQVFIYVSVPLARPMIATVAMTTLIGTWNDLIWPLVTITDKDLMPLAQGAHAILLRLSRPTGAPYSPATSSRRFRCFASSPWRCASLSAA